MTDEQFALLIGRLDRLDAKLDGLTASTNARLDSVNGRLDVVIDSLAAFRSEYNTHWHPQGPEAAA